jgi:hypothetical protein
MLYATIRFRHFDGEGSPNVDDGQAYEIADRWAAAATDKMSARDLSPRISNALPHLIPDGDVTVAVTADDLPIIVILQGHQIFLISLIQPRDAQSEPQVHCRLVHLAPASATLSVTQDWIQTTEGPVAAIALRRRWNLQIEGTPNIEFEGLDRRGGFTLGPNHAEQLGRAIADRLGWTVPSSSRA